MTDKQWISFLVYLPAHRLIEPGGAAEAGQAKVSGKIC